MKYIANTLSYITATLSGLIIFVFTFFILGFLPTLICPQTWFDIELNLGLLSTNLPSLIAIVIAGAAATHTFRASWRAGIIRWHKKTKVQTDKGEKD